MIKINSFFSKVFIILGLSGTMDQTLKANNEKKRAFIALVQEVFPNHEFIQRAFAQDLDIMGVEKSPFESEIMLWNKKKVNMEKRRRRGATIFNAVERMINDGEKIFQALVLKAMINFFDNKNEHLEKEEPCLNFDETNVNKNLLNKNNNQNHCLLTRTNLYPFKFFIDFLQNQQQIINKKEKINYFFKNFNYFIKEYNDIHFNFYDIKNILDYNVKFITFSSLMKLPPELNYFNLLIKTYEGLLNVKNEMTDHFSDNFFQNFNQRIFSHFSDMEYVFFCSYFFILDNLDSIIKVDEVSKKLKYILTLLNKKIIFSNFNEHIVDFTITKDNLQKILNTIFMPLKSLYFYRHTLCVYSHISSLKIFQNFNKDKNYKNYMKESSDKREYEEVKYLVIQDVENVYIKKALQVAYKIFFISFMDENFNFKFLDKFKAVDYNNYLFKLKNKIKGFLTKEEMDLHENFYTSKDGFNFALCAKNQFKRNGNTNNFISSFSLEYFVGSDDFSDIFGDKDDQFFKKMEECLKILDISIVPKSSYIKNLALKRMEFLKNTLEKITLSQKKVIKVKKKESSEDLVMRLL